MSETQDSLNGLRKDLKGRRKQRLTAEEISLRLNSPVNSIEGELNIQEGVNIF